MLWGRWACRRITARAACLAESRCHCLCGFQVGTMDIREHATCSASGDDYPLWSIPHPQKVLVSWEAASPCRETTFPQRAKPVPVTSSLSYHLGHWWCTYFCLWPRLSPDFRLVYTAGHLPLNMVKASSLSSSKPESLSLSCSVNGCSILSAPRAKNLVSPLIPFSLTHIEASGNYVNSTFKMRKRN